MKTTLETPKRNLTPQLTDSIQYVKGVGPKRAELFKRLGINLKFYLPGMLFALFSVSVKFGF